MPMIKNIESPECGLMQIKGGAYEDIIAILCNNGYTTEVTTEPVQTNYQQAIHVIRYWKGEK